MKSKEFIEMGGDELEITASEGIILENVITRDRAPFSIDITNVIDKKGKLLARIVYKRRYERKPRLMTSASILKNKKTRTKIRGKRK